MVVANLLCELSFTMNFPSKLSVDRSSQRLGTRTDNSAVYFKDLTAACDGKVGVTTRDLQAKRCQIEM